MSKFSKLKYGIQWATNFLSGAFMHETNFFFNYAPGANCSVKRGHSGGRERNVTVLWRKNSVWNYLSNRIRDSLSCKSWTLQYARERQKHGHGHGHVTMDMDKEMSMELIIRRSAIVWSDVQHNVGSTLYSILSIQYRLSQISDWLFHLCTFVLVSSLLIFHLLCTARLSFCFIIRYSLFKRKRTILILNRVQVFRSCWLFTIIKSSQ